MSQKTVSTSAELLAALGDGGRDIRVVGTLRGMPSLLLPPGVCLSGGVLAFGANGLVLSTDNHLDDIDVRCPPQEVAIGNTTVVKDLGHLSLRGVRTSGQILIVVDGQVRQGSVEIDGVHVAEADLRGRELRPHGYGVDVLQGALTIWNRHRAADVVISVEARQVSAGSTETPIRGSGVFVGGHCDDNGRPDGGRLAVGVLETTEVTIDGGIPADTPDLISGGVFVQAGASVDTVVNSGPTTTLGANDMALDNWGTVQRWSCTAKVTTRGPSGIGFVNFGDLDQLDVQVPIETFGLGARGFNLYDGSLNSATFDAIATHGDGAVGIQVAKPLPALTVRRDVTTAGARGMSLVRGELVELQAVAVSVKAGGHINRLAVGGDIRTTGGGVTSLELLGTIDHLDVGGRVVADGIGAQAALVTGLTKDAVEGVDLVAPKGQPLTQLESGPS